MKPMITVQALINHTQLARSGEFSASIIEGYAFPAQTSLQKAVQLRSSELITRIAIHTPKDITNHLRRLRDVNVALYNAIRDGQLHLADLLVDTFGETCIRRGALQAISHDAIAFLQRMRHENRPMCWGARMLTVAVRSGSLEMIEWLHNIRIRGRGIELVIDASRRSDPRILTWVLTNTNAPVTDYALIGACERGQMENIAALVRRLGRIHPDCVTHAAATGQAEVVQWLHDHGAEFTYQAMDTAAGAGHLQVVIWLHENRLEGCTKQAMDNAILEGHTQIIQWLFDNRSEGCSDSGMLLAVTGNTLETAQWLYENVAMAWTGMLIDECALYGSVVMLQWLHERYPNTCTKAAMDSAVHSGNHEIFEWLQVNRTEGYTTAALEHAAARGDLVCAKRLTRANITTRAVDLAAAHGYTEVLEWFNTNGADKCSIAAFDTAAANGYLTTIKYLDSNFEAPCTANAMDQAAQNGHLDVVIWLHENRTEGCTKRALDSAAGNGHFDIVIFLHYNRTEGCSRLASILAAENDELEIAQWLKLFYPLEFDSNSVREQARSHAWPAVVMENL